MGICADGVCCNANCNGSCQACDLAMSRGTCAPIVGDPHPGHPSCGANMVCSGTNGCIACTSGSACIPTNVCDRGTISCTTGSPVCVDSGTAATDGSVCGRDLYCNGGQCVSCSAALPGCKCDGFIMPNPSATDLPNPSSYDYMSITGTVIDNVTGLMWERTVSSSTYTQPQAVSYCIGNRLAGYSDWYLPSLVELTSIVDYNQPFPKIVIDPNAFPSTPNDVFWTATVSQVNAGFHWHIYFRGNDGTPNVSAGDSYPGRVRCVRRSIPTKQRCFPSDSRFQIQSGSLVYDAATSLTWQQTNGPAMTSADARTYCANIGIGFRLPSMKELITIVDYFHSSVVMIDSNAFPNTPADLFWTSSREVDLTTQVYAVSFISGDSRPYDSTDAHYVRCVR